jgi:hypothetical protein
MEPKPLRGTSSLSRQTADARVRRTRPMFAAVYDLEIDSFVQASALILNWLKKHRLVGGRLDICNPKRCSLDYLVTEGLLAEFVVSSDGCHVTATLAHREHRQPGRAWRVEVTIDRNESVARFAVRTWFTGFEADRRASKGPRFLRELCELQCLFDCVVLRTTPWIIDSDQDIQAVTRLISNEGRRLPVTLVSDACEINVARLASESTGLAHICVLRESVQDRFVEFLGSSLGFDQGGIQTYYSTLAGRKVEAPVVMSSTRIAATGRLGKTSGREAIVDKLLRDYASAVTSRFIDDVAHRSLITVNDVADAPQTAFQALSVLPFHHGFARDAHDDHSLGPQIDELQTNQVAIESNSKDERVPADVPSSKISALAAQDIDGQTTVAGEVYQSVSEDNRKSTPAKCPADANLNAFEQSEPITSNTVWEIAVLVFILIAVGTVFSFGLKERPR